METKHVFGPVQSRRLGHSLGVDIIPRKICSYDCIYCQLGRTTDKTVKRDYYCSVPDVLQELKETLEKHPSLDYVTITGSGEPTLHTGLGDIIEGIKRLTDTPVALLTNSSMFRDAEVRKACNRVDTVMPSLDVGDEYLFTYVNRPSPAISFDEMIDGLITFRQQHSGIIWLEVFLLGGVTAIGYEVRKIRKLAEKIRPNLIQLNTAVRPASEKFVNGVSEGQMTRLRKLMGPEAKIIPSWTSRNADHTNNSERCYKDDIVEILRRRPSTTEEIASGLSMNLNDTFHSIDNLIAEGRVCQFSTNGHDYLIANVCEW
jgi:wyosine [tRNA(Phe)-imidazoG37] synthetase (radical SAM superfamily)